MVNAQTCTKLQLQNEQLLSIFHLSRIKLGVFTSYPSAWTLGETQGKVYVGYTTCDICPKQKLLCARLNVFICVYYSDLLSLIHMLAAI